MLFRSQQENPEDKFWGAIAKGGKGGYNFVSDIVKSFKNFDTFKRLAWGRNVILTSGIIVIVSIFAKLFGAQGVLQFIIGGLLSAGVAIPVFMAAMEDIKDGNCQEKEEAPEIFESDEIEELEDDVFTGEVETDEALLFGNLDEEEPSFASAYDEDDDLSYEPPSVPNPLEALEKLNSNMGMVTRQYLYELVNSCLSNKYQ